jgi:ubiquinol-cytochrome c reductase cytochrome b subunit
MHVLLLPPATMLLIAVHIYLVRKHGVAPAAGDTFPRKKFFPEQVFKDTLAIFVAFTILAIMAVVARVPLGQLADPTDTAYIPRPDWYFLFLFQTLKFFEGPLEVVGSVVLPGLAVTALFLVPFFDRGRVRRVTERTAANGVVLLAASGGTGLTVAAIRTTPPSTQQAEFDGPQDWQELSPEALAGIGYFRRENCAGCHPVGEGGSKTGPDLTKTAIRKDAKWMIDHFKAPQQLMPGSSMPAIRLTDSQLNALAAFLLKLNAKNAAALQSAPEFAVEGAILYQAHRCGTCHIVNGFGMKMGPPLNGLAKRRTRDWVEFHFLEPQKYSPGTIMPAYKFSRREMDRITSYLMALPN